jgi:hypothetical protein
MLVRTLLFAIFTPGLALLGQDVPASLTKEEIAAGISGEVISLPMPGELFAALGKHGKPDWSALLRKTPAAAFTSRQQIALNLGALVADGYLAVEAQDKQQVKNIAADIKRLAKGVNVSKELVSRGNSIIEFADGGQWETLKEELEATQNEVIAAMNSHKDQDLVTLVMLGGWLRGTQAVSVHIAKSYTADAAKVLRQPAVVHHFVQKLANMPKEFTGTPLMTAVRLALFDIRKAVTFSADASPSAADVTKLSELATTIMTAISTKDQ